jgi:hypothetical protein
MPGSFLFWLVRYDGHVKTLFTFCAAFVLLAVGCDNKSTTATSSTNTTASSSSPLDAPGNYLKAVANGQQSAVKTVDTTSLNKAIELFNVDQGRNPKDLDELVQKKYIPKIPETPFGTRLQYDPTAGNVKVVPAQKQ